MTGLVLILELRVCSPVWVRLHITYWDEQDTDLLQDMTMPGDSDSYNSPDSYFGTNLTIAVLNGTVPAWRIDDMAMRIMAGFFYVDMDVEREPINFSSWTFDTYGYERYYTGEGGTTQVNCKLLKGRDYVSITSSGLCSNQTRSRRS